MCMYGMIMAQNANHAKPPVFFFKVTPLRFLWMVPWQLDDDPGSPDWYMFFYPKMDFLCNLYRHITMEHQ